jgi:hypothetical protein
MTAILSRQPHARCDSDEKCSCIRMHEFGRYRVVCVFDLMNTVRITGLEAEYFIKQKSRNDIPRRTLFHAGPETEN